jgi:acetyl esterase/lipase
VIVRPDQVYAQPDGVPLRFDLFRPETDELLPLVVCIHGGGWISGSKEDMRDVALVIAGHGFAAACLNYRLAPLHPYPAAVEDIHAFLASAHRNAKEWKIDESRIAALGNSAGGHLACMAGLSGPREYRADTVIDICGITDLTRPREQHLSISWSFLEGFMGVDYEGNEELYREASPLYHVDTEAPPFLVIHGDSDDVVPIEQSQALVSAFEQYNVRYEYHPMPGEMHSFSFLGWAKIEQLFLQFLTERFSHALR